MLAHAEIDSARIRANGGPRKKNDRIVNIEMISFQLTTSNSLFQHKNEHFCKNHSLKNVIYFITMIDYNYLAEEYQ